MEQIEIKTIIYKASDGKEFKDKQECEKHDKYISAPDCKLCNGEGKTHEHAGYDCWGRSEFWTNKCNVCNGTGKQLEGYQEKLDAYNLIQKLKYDYDL